MYRHKIGYFFNDMEINNWGYNDDHHSIYHILLRLPIDDSSWQGVFKTSKHSKEYVYIIYQ